MHMKFAIYSLVVLGIFAYSGHKGIVYSSLFSKNVAAQKSAGVYHK